MVTNDVKKIKFSEEDVALINEHLTIIESLLKEKTIQLAPGEGKRFGKLGPENEKWANNVYHDVTVAPQLLPPFMEIDNWNELEKTREQLSTLTDRFKTVTQLLVDSNRLIGYSIYKKCLTVYKNAQMLTEEGISGVKIYLDKWSVFFEKKPKETKVNAPQ
jgi:hypothetical protein